MLKLKLKEITAILCALAATLLTQPALGSTEYKLHYDVELSSSSDLALVTLRIPDASAVKEIDFNLNKKIHHDIEGNGKLELNDDRAVWTPPSSNASLQLKVSLNQKRRNGGFDSRHQEDFAIFRGDDLVPPARVLTKSGASSAAYLTFSLPDGWRSVNSGWPKNEDGSFTIDSPERRFDRPTGWFIAGDLGTRRERLNDIHIAVSGPKGQDIRRLDILSFILLNLDALREVVGQLPEKVLIVSAGDPMWLGGLSGPNSLFYHADRPLVSENGTSSLLHELFHTMTGIIDEGNDDWISEGMAEYYAVEVLYRSGGLSDARYEKVYGWLEDFGKDVAQLRGPRSSGEKTARAVLLFKELAEEIYVETEHKYSLDDLTKALINRGQRVNLSLLQEEAEKLLGRPSKVLQSPLLKS